VVDILKKLGNPSSSTDDVGEFVPPYYIHNFDPDNQLPERSGYARTLGRWYV
jgi:hypothetical protein